MYIYIAHSAGLVVSSPEMEEEVVILILTRAVPRILIRKLQAQLSEHDKNSASQSQYFKYNQTQKENNKINLLTTVDQKGYG